MGWPEIVAVVLGGVLIAAVLCWVAVTIASRLARRRASAVGGGRGDEP